MRVEERLANQGVTKVVPMLPVSRRTRTEKIGRGLMVTSDMIDGDLLHWRRRHRRASALQIGILRQPNPQARKLL
jgi:hypothetical protein